MVSGVADSPFPRSVLQSLGQPLGSFLVFAVLSGFVKCYELRRAEVLEGRLIEIHFAIRKGSYCIWYMSPPFFS